MIAGSDGPLANAAVNGRDLTDLPGTQPASESISDTAATDRRAGAGSKTRTTRTNPATRSA